VFLSYLSFTTFDFISLNKTKHTRNVISFADYEMSLLAATTASIIDEPFTIVLVSAIPKSFRSADLRNFFSQLVESRAFRCFHFRHRPVPPSSDNAVSVSQMCFVQIYNKRLKEFIKLYHRKHWINVKGNYLSALCLISEVTNEDPAIINNLIEFKPSKLVYPQGNVGTPTSYFLNEINACRLPSTIISMLKSSVECE